MNSKLKCGAIAIVGLAIGFFVGRGSKSPSSSVPEFQPAQVSVFENEALGFLNWFRIEGRSEISHDELVRNLRILESKAIGSGKLLAFKDQKSEAEQAGTGQPATRPKSKSEGGDKPQPEAEGGSW